MRPFLLFLLRSAFELAGWPHTAALVDLLHLLFEIPVDQVCVGRGFREAAVGLR